MRIVADGPTDFVPDFKGNQDLHPEDQIKLKLRPLTTRERQRFFEVDIINFALQHAKNGKDPADMGGLVNVDYPGVFESAVVEITNLEVNGRKIVTAREALDAPANLQGLLTEVVMQVLRDNTRDEVALGN